MAPGLPAPFLLLGVLIRTLSRTLDYGCNRGECERNQGHGFDSRWVMREDSSAEKNPCEGEQEHEEETVQDTSGQPGPLPPVMATLPP